MQNIDPRHLRYFLAVFDARSFSRAAEILFVTQSAVSKAMRDLEEELGTPLYFRHSSSVTPTEDGLQFYDCVCPLVTLYDDCLAEYCAARSRSAGTFRLGISLAADQRLLQVARRVLAEQSPRFALETKCASTAQTLEDLRMGRLDVALATLPCKEPRTRVLPIGRERMVVCMRTDDDLARVEEVGITSISTRLKVFYSPAMHPEAHSRLMTMLACKGVVPVIPLFSSSNQETLNMVQHGYGLALVREHLELLPGLTTRPLSGLDWTIDSAILYRPSMRHRHVRRWSERLQRILLRRPLRGVRLHPDSS